MSRKGWGYTMHNFVVLQERKNNQITNEISYKYAQKKENPYKNAAQKPGKHYYDLS